MSSSDCSQLLEELNCGQHCFLRGLIHASKSSVKETDSYGASEHQAAQLSSKAHNIRERLNQLFNNT